MSGGVHVGPKKGQKGNKKVAMWILLPAYFADNDAYMVTGVYRSCDVLQCTSRVQQGQHVARLH